MLNLSASRSKSSKSQSYWLFLCCRFSTKLRAYSQSSYQHESCRNRSITQQDRLKLLVLPTKTRLEDLEKDHKESAPPFFSNKTIISTPTTTSTMATAQQKQQQQHHNNDSSCSSSNTEDYNETDERRRKFFNKNRLRNGFGYDKSKINNFKFTSSCFTLPAVKTIHRFRALHNKDIYFYFSSLVSFC